MKKQRLLVFFIVLLAAFTIIACKTNVNDNKAIASSKIKVNNTVHPEDMGNQDCIECHKDITPEVVQQWEESAHGFTGVKCQVCHGDQQNFNSIPANDTCRGCHAKQFENNTAVDKSCSSCHTAHNFTIHKVNHYK